MELRRMELDQGKQIYDQYMTVDFPPEELKAWKIVESLYKRGCYDFLAAFEGDDFLGYSFQFCPKDTDTILLDYLSVIPRYRGKGIGGTILEALRVFYADTGKVILLESEYPPEAPDPGIAQRRLGFYRRSGMVDTQVQVRLFGVRFCIFASSRIPDAARRMMDTYREMLDAELFETQAKLL